MILIYQHISTLSKRCDSESRIPSAACQAGAGSLDDFATSIAELRHPRSRKESEMPQLFTTVHDCSRLFL